ncbi:MAG TPA: phosphoribosylanthranilate isomerase [bacterium]|jgi:phosphoribosylanthranilate isomerase
MVRIKICGILDVENALAAADAGADAIGLVFAPSRRRVTGEQAQAIVNALPPFVTKVGLFVDADLRTIHEVADVCALDVIQLHGNESPEFCAGLHRPVIKAIRVKDASSLTAMDAYRVAAFLLDGFHPEIAGGTGLTFDWNLAAELDGSYRVILSGGLTPDNVGDAIRTVHPYGVDVSSGVETDGRKDPVKIREFINRAKGL